MSDKDEVIPVLNDVVVTGDLDKAVTNDNELQSIDDFDALFESNNSNADKKTAPSPETEAFNSIEDNSIDVAAVVTTDNSDLFSADETTNQSDELPFSDEAVSSDILMDLAFEDATPNDTSTDLEIEESSDTFPLDISQDNNDIHLNQTEDNSLEDTFELSRSEPVSEVAVDSTSDLETEIALEDAFELSLTEPMSDVAIDSDNDNNTDTNTEFENITTENPDTQIDIEDITPPVDTSSADEPETTAISQFANPPTLDIDQLAADVMTEIMPAIEMQIKTLVLHSLKNHLTAALNTDDPADDE